MVKHNMRIHELIGLLQIFVGAIWLGFGFVSAMLIANKILIGAQVYQLMDVISIILFFGPGAVLIMLGIIEVRKFYQVKSIMARLTREEVEYGIKEFIQGVIDWINCWFLNW